MENHNNEKNDYRFDNRARKVLRIIGMVFVGLIFAVLFALVFGFIVKWLWNFLMPGLFGLKQITYWQAFAIVILAKLLFGTFGKDHHDHRDRPPYPFRKWHDRFHRLEDEPWNRRSRQWRYYRKYWDDEGKAAFEAYMRKIEKEGEVGNGAT